MNAAELLVYLESLLERNVPLHKLEIRTVCADCDCYSEAQSVTVAANHITFEWEEA